MYRIITYSTSFLKIKYYYDLFFGNVKNLTAKKGIHTLKYFFCFPLVKEELDQRERYTRFRNTNFDWFNCINARSLNRRALEMRLQRLRMREKRREMRSEFSDTPTMFTSHLLTTSRNIIRWTYVNARRGRFSKNA